MRTRALMILIVVCFSSPVRAETNYSTGSYMLPPCRDLVEDKTPEVWQGQCAGIALGLIWVGKILPANHRFCKPNGVGTEQAVRIIVKYLDQHPEQLGLDFRGLVLDAFRQAWPCSG
jgi:hypothetical protein